VDEGPDRQLGKGDGGDERLTRQVTRLEALQHDDGIGVEDAAVATHHVDISVSWAAEAAADPGAVVAEPDPVAHGRRQNRRVLALGWICHHCHLAQTRWSVVGCHGVEDHRRRAPPVRGGTAMMWSTDDIDELLAPTAAEYDAEERAAAEQELREAENEPSSLVFSVRLSPELYTSVRAAASRAHLTPSALLRQWVSERVELGPDEDRSAVVAALRRDVDRVARLLDDQTSTRG
jgi:hypothetical protein